MTAEINPRDHRVTGGHQHPNEQLVVTMWDYHHGIMMEIFVFQRGILVLMLGQIQHTAHHFSYLCFICTISSLLRPRILSCLLRSRTDSVTRSSSVIPHCKEALETRDQSREHNGAVTSVTRGTGEKLHDVTETFRLVNGESDTFRSGPELTSC